MFFTQILKKLALAVPQIRRFHVQRDQLYQETGRLLAQLDANQRQLRDLEERLRLLASDVERHVREKEELLAQLRATERSEKSTTPASAITFRELLQESRVLGELDECMPSLVFMHIPKAAGITVDSALKDNFSCVLLARGNDFFGGGLNDTIRSYFTQPAYFTGHVNLRSDIFSIIPRRLYCVTVLRDPVERMVSNYNFTLRAQKAPWHEEVATGKMDVVDLASAFTERIGHQYQYFLDREPSNGETAAAAALRNLEEKVTLFGFAERLDEFLLCVGLLLGCPKVFYPRPLNTSKELPLANPNDPLGGALVTPDKAQIEKLRSLLKDDIDFYENGKNVYLERLEAVQARLGGKAAFAAALKKYRSLSDQYRSLLGQSEELFQPGFPSHPPYFKLHPPR